MIANSLDEMPRPRLMKSHLPVQLLPDEVWTKNPKLFYISREVKDVAVSFYHYIREQGRKHFTLDEFLEKFLNDSVVNAPYRENLENYLNLPNYSNIMYLTYESMSRNMNGTIRKVAEFLGKTVSEENLMKLKEHLSFEKMRGNKHIGRRSLKIDLQFITFTDSNATNEIFSKNRSHIRKGIIGDFNNEMPEEFIRRFDDWIAKSHCLNQGFNFKVDVND